MSKVLVSFIQDRSGSMGGIWDETLNGFKCFVEELKKGEENDEYLFSLTVFDTQVDRVLSAVPIKDVDPDVLKKHGPRGSTALYDAAGKTIKDIEDNDHGADKIICVICTDGQENSSREWKKEDLHAAIDRLLKGKWTFTYLGTQPETWDDAQAIGVGAGSSACYVGQAAGSTYTVTAGSVNALAKSASVNTRSLVSDFSDKHVRASIGMKTRLDDVQVSVNAQPSVTVPPSKATKDITALQNAMKPKTKKKDTSGRKWK